MPHDPSRGFVGENLWMGGVGLSSTAQQVEDWVYEKNNYHGGPYNPQPGDPVIGHYTQMVWRNTNEIGCATASDGTMDFLVCRYSPLGNVRGQNPY
jgi:pathogenesis-related protein 1